MYGQIELKKAYDLVEWAVLESMMETLDSILINGKPSKVFPAAKGLR